MTNTDYARFQNWSFETFRKAASDPALSPYEKIGFPSEYRRGKEASIWADIRQKLPNLGERKQLVLDIGPGCSDLPRMLIEMCRSQGHQLLLVDSGEMLAHLPDEPFITKIPGYYPRDCQPLFEAYAGQVNVILSYSVLQYVFAEGNVFDFVDRSLHLLAEGGELLIGDIPNVSKRKRFFASSAGVRFHQQFMQTGEAPEVAFNRLEAGNIDDGVLLGLVARCRSAGYDAYLAPQSPDLPLANRREDLLIQKP
jgi:hypothetical protein